MNSVSIAMATYNGERHIQRQLASLSAQTQLPAELVITDDASADGTLKTVEAFAKTAPFPVHVHRNEIRLGYRANFMRAASLCRSELIAFCDQDDYWYQYKIAECVKPFGDLEVLLAYHNADTVTENGTKIGSLAERAARLPILGPLSSGPWWPFALGFTEVFRRSLMPLSHLWPKTLSQYEDGELLGHDGWFFFLASVFGKIAYLDGSLAAYVQHGNNAYGWRRGSRVQWILRDRFEEYDRFQRASERLAVILDIANGDLEGIWVERAAAASDYYRMVAWLFAKRKTLYTSANFSERLNALRDILRKNGYAGNWGISQKTLMADLCIGVLPIGQLVRASAG